MLVCRHVHDKDRAMESVKNRQSDDGQPINGGPDESEAHDARVWKRYKKVVAITCATFEDL